MTFEELAIGARFRWANYASKGGSLDSIKTKATATTYVHKDCPDAVNVIDVRDGQNTEVVEVPRPVIQECQFITLSDLLSADEYQYVCDVVTNHFSWGDTMICLVDQANLRSALEAKAKGSRNQWEEHTISKVLEAMDDVGDSVYVNLY